ncbi:MAG: galactose mutarotase [Chloroflexi bacterium]|nr:galactose mutarotase [Chloroflexota bacterium]
MAVATSSPGGTVFRLAGARLRARVLAYGGILQALEVPDPDGRWHNVTLGFADPDQYRRANPAYFGATIGRFANRIAGGTFSLDGRSYKVPVNNGQNSLHGGPGGFHNRIWQPTQVSETRVALQYVSPDGEEGYPGTVHVTVTYSIQDVDSLRLDYLATADAPTVVNLTNHAYFNLAGKGDIYNHVVWLNASHYLPVDTTQIPTGLVAPVDGTPFDFRQPTAIGAHMPPGGYDHNWVLDGWTSSTSAPLLQARVTEPTSGRALEVWTTEPGIQFYTGNLLEQRGAGFTLETQHYPDAPNQPTFPSTVLRPGKQFRSTTIYRLSAGA